MAQQACFNPRYRHQHIALSASATNCKQCCTHMAFKFYKTVDFYRLVLQNAIIIDNKTILNG